MTNSSFSNKVAGQPYYHPWADTAFVWAEAVVFSKTREQTGRTRMPASVCVCARTLEPSALRATDPAAASTALTQRPARILLSHTGARSPPPSPPTSCPGAPTD